MPAIMTSSRAGGWPPLDTRPADRPAGPGV